MSTKLPEHAPLLPAELTTDPMLTTAQAAEWLGVASTRTLEDWRRQGVGPDYVPLTPRMVRYRLSALRAYVSAREVRTLKASA